MKETICTKLDCCDTEHAPFQTRCNSCVTSHSDKTTQKEVLRNSGRLQKQYF